MVAGPKVKDGQQDCGSGAQETKVTHWTCPQPGTGRTLLLNFLRLHALRKSNGLPLGLFSCSAPDVHTKMEWLLLRQAWWTRLLGAVDVKIPGPGAAETSRQVSRDVPRRRSSSNGDCGGPASGCRRPYTSPCEEPRPKAGEGQLQARAAGLRRDVAEPGAVPSLRGAPQTQTGKAKGGNQRERTALRRKGRSQEYGVQ